MVKVRLPDGKLLDFPDGTTAAEVVASIGPGLARKTIAARLDGVVSDLSIRLRSGGEPIVFHALTETDPDALTVARHSCAHVMAEAICALWPQTKLVYGPPVENG